MFSFGHCPNYLWIFEGKCLENNQQIHESQMTETKQQWKNVAPNKRVLWEDQPPGNMRMQIGQGSSSMSRSELKKGWNQILPKEKEVNRSETFETKLQPLYFDRITKAFSALGWCNLSASDITGVATEYFATEYFYPLPTNPKPIIWRKSKQMLFVSNGHDSEVQLTVWRCLGIIGWHFMERGDS